MKKMAELQLSVVIQAKNKQAIVSQVHPQTHSHYLTLSHCVSSMG